MCEDPRHGRAPIRDAELVRRALAGSGEAYRQIVRRFERPVMSLIVRMVRDPATAEDLAQETFVKAFRNLRRYDPRRKLASWLFKIAHNTTLDHLRRKSLDTVPLERTSGGRGPSTDAADEDTWEVLAASKVWAPDRRTESAELAAALERALARVQPNYREILLLRFREGLAYRDIADVVDLPMGTVKIQLHRARKQLLRELEKLGFAADHESAGATAKQEPATSRRVATKESRE